MSDKFNKVATDIIEMINDKKYDDKDMEFYKTQILFTLYRMTESQKTYERGIQVLKKTNEKRY